jgi:hypothetical protein
MLRWWRWAIVALGIVMLPTLIMFQRHMWAKCIAVHNWAYCWATGGKF